MTTQAATQRLPILLLGCGQIGRLHAARLAADPRAEIVALCDPQIDSARSVASLYGPTALVSAHLDESLKAVSVAGAVVCTPTGQHFEQVRQLRSRGISVLCEKPLADSRERLRTLIAESREGPLLSVAYQRRYSAAFRAARREIAIGRLGRIRSVVVSNCERWAQTIRGTWRDDPRQNPGGFLGDAGSHKVDMVFFLTGLRCREVQARSQRRGWNVEVVTQICALLGDDVALSMNFVGDAHHFDEEFRIHGDHADLIVRDDRLEIAVGNHRERLEFPETDSNPDTAFLDCLSGHDANQAPAEVALPVWDFTFGALESARTGMIVRFPDE